MKNKYLNKKTKNNTKTQQAASTHVSTGTQSYEFAR